MNTFVVEPVFGSLSLAILLVFLGLFIVISLGVPRDGLSDHQRRWLGGLRLGALGLLALALIRPTIVRTDSKPAPATLAVLLDGSRSMGLSDGEGKSRWESQTSAARELKEGFEEFDESLQIQWYAYGREVISFDEAPPDSWLTSDPEEPQTDYAAALRRAVEGVGGKPLAGVILAGDGTLTATGVNPANVVRTLAALDVPLWTIPIGPRNASEETRDLGVGELAEAFEVFTKNTFQIRFVVQAKGMVGAEVPISISLIDGENKRQEIATRTLVAESSELVVPFELELEAPAPGSYQLEVYVPEQSGESITENNRQVAFIDVREGGGRILYVEGEPRLEQLFLRRAINASPDLELTFQLISRGTQNRWPVDLGVQGKASQYDVYVIGDIDSAALGEATLRAIAEAVERDGSGLLMIGGVHTFDLGGYGTTPLADVLPIRLDPTKRVNVNQSPPASAMLPAPVKVRVKRPHPLTLLAGVEGNTEAWGSLKPLLGANRFGELKVAPGIEVLLESTNEEPLLVVGQAGAGRTAVFAGDTTWQWWRQQKSDYHRRFWRQMMLWLLAREEREEGALWLQLEARRFERMTPSTFSVGVGASASEKPPEIRAEAIDARGKRWPVQLRQSAAGTEIVPRGQRLATGVLPDLPGGVYRLRVFSEDHPGGAQEEGLQGAEQLFQVIDIDAEMSRPQAEVSRLEQLATLTQDAGGRSYRWDQMGALIDQIKTSRRRAEMPVVEQYRLGDGPISGWLLMLGMLSLLSSEWILRKRWHQA